MKNIIIQTYNGALALATSLIKGVNKHGLAAKVKQNTEDVITADRTAAVTAADTLDVGRQLARTLRVTFFAARSEARRLAMLARDILKPIFGNEYNESWDITGFVGSIGIPKDILELEQLLEKLKLFFAANPQYEVAVREVTSAKFAALFTALSEARMAVAEQDAVVQQLTVVRDNAFTTLRKRMRGLIDELTLLLDPMDPLWLAFGLNRPGADETPEAPTGLMATLVSATTAALKWTVPPRTEYFRVWQKIHGSDGDYVAVASPTDPDVTLETLPAASTIDIVVTALNNGGESAFSEVVTITTR